MTPREGSAQLEEAIALWRDLGDRDELASALDSLGWLLVYDAGDEAGALAAFEQSLELRRELGDTAGETRALVGVCQVLVALGDVERAESLSRELLERADGDPRTEHFAYHFLADCALIRGDTEEAEKRYRESLRGSASARRRHRDELRGPGRRDGRRRQATPSAPCAWLGRSRRCGSRSASRSPSRSGTRFSSATSARRASSWASDADAVWAEGRAMAFDDAVELALDGALARARR